MPKLKRKISQEEYEALSESRREDYIKGQDGYLLDDDGTEDVNGLKSALEKQKKEVRELKASLQEKADLYKDIDPEAARDALAKIRKLDEKSLLDEGKIEELFKQRLTNTQREHDAKIKALQADIDERNTKLSTLTQKLSHTSLAASLAKEATDARVDPDWFDYVYLKAQAQWRLDEAGELAPYDGDQVIYGKEGKPMSMSEWIGVLAKDKPKILLQSTGAGANGSSGRSSGKDIVLTPEQLQDPRNYAKARALAEKQGGEILSS